MCLRQSCLLPALLTAILLAACSHAPAEALAPATRELPTAAAAARAPERDARFTSADLYKLKSVGEVDLAPDATYVAYTIQNNEAPGRPTSQIWIMEIASGRTARVGSGGGTGSSPRWSPDGQRLAYLGHDGDQSGLFFVRLDDRQPHFLAPVVATNHPLPSTGARLAWAPDSKHVAFVSATPGPEGAEPGTDPVIITRYLYKPPASDGPDRFNDNRRLHIFIADLETRLTEQVTSGTLYEHSIDWSPKGDEIAFVANAEADPDRVFNYDIFTVAIPGKKVRRLTSTKSAEYRPAWSPDGYALAYLGTKRLLTSSETTMEDTHVWTIEAKGGSGREAAATIDNRHGAPRWSPDGQSIDFTVQERGSVRLYRQPIAGGPAEVVAPPPGQPGSVDAWSVAGNDTVVY
jgi:Tol biopolymer transport system component